MSTGRKTLSAALPTMVLVSGGMVHLFAVTGVSKGSRPSLFFALATAPLEVIGVPEIGKFGGPDREPAELRTGSSSGVCAPAVSKTVLVVQTG
jgi:hypothetical protein